MSTSKIETTGRCIALYPGAFRPPHAAHLTAVLDLVSRPEVDEVVVVISNRCRSIPGTTQALDPDVARQIWGIYLKNVPNVRVEVASHTSVEHALSYFNRVKTGDTLFFCIGEKDFRQGDDRFNEIEALANRTGVSARLIAAPTGTITTRSTDLRAMLSREDTGRDAFIAVLPKGLSLAQCEKVWRVCQNGMREISEIIQEKVRSIILRNKLGDILEISSAGGGKLDQVYRVHFKDGRCYFVKYAGDTVGSGRLGDKLSLKPKRRLSAERRALTRLSDQKINDVDLPEVVLFDKETLTLVLTQVCPGGKSLRDDLRNGIFDPEIARQASHFLARCHNLTAPIKPVWGDKESDCLHWKTMLDFQTVEIQSETISQDLRDKLVILKRASEMASRQIAGNRLLILNYTPKNIIVDQKKIGIIDFELSSSMGDPAYDLGILLGNYMFYGLISVSGETCQIALRDAVKAYRQGIGDLWPKMCGRVVSFAGASLLYHLTGDHNADLTEFEPRLMAAAECLLYADLDQLEDINPILSHVIGGQNA